MLFRSPAAGRLAPLPPPDPSAPASSTAQGCRSPHANCLHPKPPACHHAPHPDRCRSRLPVAARLHFAVAHNHAAASGSTGATAPRVSTPQRRLLPPGGRPARPSAGLLSWPGNLPGPTTTAVLYAREDPPAATTSLSLQFCSTCPATSVRYCVLKKKTEMTQNS